MMMDENKIVESISESYDDSENILAVKKLVAEKGDLTRNSGHTVQTA
ncbi:MAG: hypothetical protein OER82_02225 [Nitrosopumilus sp.]|nr:hypothetical protein [Nitrosopumilus sp.]MDH3853052.1 hypothetical protein [Nitrosopumilus sp.]